MPSAFSFVRSRISLLANFFFIMYNKIYVGDNMLIIGSHVSFNSKDQLLGSLNQSLEYLFSPFSIGKNGTTS